MKPAGEKFCKKVGSDNDMLSSLALPILVADVVPNGFMYHLDRRIFFNMSRRSSSGNGAGLYFCNR